VYGTWAPLLLALDYGLRIPLRDRRPARDPVLAGYHKTQLLGDTMLTCTQDVVIASAGNRTPSEKRCQRLFFIIDNQWVISLFCDNT
ncbi:MAG: hypothetical protein ACREPT_04415, partial [Rudaea sp.]